MQAVAENRVLNPRGTEPINVKSMFEVITTREMVIHKGRGLLRDRTYGMRLYEPGSLRALAADAGFGHIHLHEDFSPYDGDGDVGFMDHRMILTARKIGSGK
jgi:hypothetical protein